MRTDEFFDFRGTLTERLFLSERYPWDALDNVCEYIRRIGRGLDKKCFTEVKCGVWVADSAAISESAELIAPLIIDAGAEVGNFSVVSSSVIGRDCVIGSFSDIRHSIFLDFSRAPAHNYVSNSIVGKRARFGAGAIVSSMRADRREVICETDTERLNTGRVRFGALVGDGAEIGPSAVLSAGCVVERDASVNPLTRARGFVSAGKTYRGERITYDLL